MAKIIEWTLRVVAVGAISVVLGYGLAAGSIDRSIRTYRAPILVGSVEKNTETNAEKNTETNAEKNTETNTEKNTEAEPDEIEETAIVNQPPALEEGVLQEEGGPEEAEQS